MAFVGYARTSTVEQKSGFEAQQRDLLTAGVTKLFKEQLSSVDKSRPQLDAALDYVREGDTLVVTKLDRLARSMNDLVRITSLLKEKDVELHIIGLKLDTSTPTGKLMLNMMGSIAEFERELMLERQREGIASAKANGKYKGRAPTARNQADKVLGLRDLGETVDTIVAELGISRSSVFRILRDHGAEASPVNTIATG